MAYAIRAIARGDEAGLAQVRALLASENLTLDAHLDYTCGLFDDADTLLATGSCFASTLRCFAVAKAHQGEGLLNGIVTHLEEVQAARGNFHLFVYTKPQSARFFESLGFFEIARPDDTLVFMENRKRGFKKFCAALCKTRRPGTAAAIVMNANPFTLGHRYLVEQAAQRYEAVHLFVLSEDRSFFPADVRLRLVQADVRDLPNVILHETKDYLISAATFPGYFLKGSDAAARAGARLDAALFVKIAAALGVSARLLGEEPASGVTRLYNAVLQQTLTQAGLAVAVLPRLCLHGKPVSASDVRQAIHDGDWTQARELVPPATWAYLRSEEAQPVLAAIRSADDVRHF